MQKVVFLDFDGVLLTDHHARAQVDQGLTHKNYLQTVKFDPDCVHNLLKLVHDTESEIVLSTSWALGHSLSELGACLQRNGIDPHLLWEYDDPSEHAWMTPRRMTSNRALEISRWIRNHPHVTTWCAIDDLTVIQSLGHHAVVTDPQVGFDSSCLAQALAILS